MARRTLKISLRFLKIGVICTFFVCALGCADVLNNQFPKASDELAEITNVAYGSYEDSYVYDSVSGTLSYSSDYDIYYFKSAKGETYYTIEWENGVGAKAAVSVSSSPYFHNTVFSDDTSGSHTIKTTSARFVYIKVYPYNYSYYNTGSYTLKVSGKTDSIELHKYN